MGPGQRIRVGCVPPFFLDTISSWQPSSPREGPETLMAKKAVKVKWAATAWVLAAGHVV